MHGRRRPLQPAPPEPTTLLVQSPPPRTCGFSLAIIPSGPPPFGINVCVLSSAARCDWEEWFFFVLLLFLLILLLRGAESHVGVVGCCSGLPVTILTEFGVLYESARVFVLFVLLIELVVATAVKISSFQCRRRRNGLAF